MGCLVALVVLVLLPIVEVDLLVELARRVGPLPVLGWVLAAGLLGGAVARRGGAGALGRARQELGRGPTLGEAALDGALVTLAGLLLAWPGPLTDAAGLLLLVPPLRRRAARGVADWARRRMVVVGDPGAAMPFPGARGGDDAGGDIIDVEAVVRDPTPPRDPAPPPSLPG